MPPVDPADTIATHDAEPGPAPDGAGRVLGEFVLVERIGAGAFAEVWRARQPRLEREAAVKIPHPVHLARPALVQRFLREARLAARLDHPWAAHVYDCGAEPDGTAWIAMEFVRGEALSARLAREGPLPLDEAVALVGQLAQVVAAAHRRGIVHRDIKPANVLVVEEGGRRWPKLLDFGIARELEALPPGGESGGGEPGAREPGGGEAGPGESGTGESGAGDPGGPAPPPAPARTGHGARLGSPLYMAPEQWRDARSADARSDQYALAVLAYEALTGQAPFRASTIEGIAEAHALHPLPVLGPRFPRGLDAVLARGAAKRPEARFPDVESFVRALEAAAAAASRPDAALHRIPAAASAFIGREAERAAVADAITRSRLVTVLGVGGAGKTRLSLQVAADVAGSFPDGVCVAELVEVHSAAEVAPAVARALGLEDGSLGALRAWLAPRRLLLVLDNCEHLVEPAASFVHSLLRGCPGLSVLATSREALGVPGETTWPLPPLALPRAGAPLEEAATSDAVKLFVERAAAADPAFRLGPENFDAVVDICRRLDGIPLALELAAARVRALPPAQLARRLRSGLAALGQGPRAGTPHHRTLRAAIEWGHTLLGEEERRAFRRLAALPGPFELDVAAVAMDGSPDDDRVFRLVDRSLVAPLQGGGARFRLLEPLRDYGLEQLEVAGETTPTRLRLLRWLRDEALREEEEGFGPEALAYHRRWSGRTELLADLLGRAPALGAVPLALELLHPLWRHWEVSPPSGEVRAATARLLEAAGPATTPEDARRLGGAWEAYGAQCWRAGDLGAAHEAHLRAIELARRAGDPRLLTVALFGAASGQLGADPARARAWLDEARALAEPLGQPRLLAYTDHHLASLALQEGRLDEAEGHLDRVRAQVNAAGDRHGALVNLYQRALLARRRGLAAQARWVLGRVVTDAPRTGDLEAVAECLELLSEWLLEDGDAALAVRWEASAQGIRRDGEDPLNPDEARAHTERVTRARDTLGDAAFRAAWEEGAAWDLDRVLRHFAAQPAPA